MSSVAVIDYGMGNLHSIAKALQHACPEQTIQVTSDAGQIRQADRIVFPGVGAIRDCIQALQANGLQEVIQEVAKNKPFLGICLGMQALLTDSEENDKTPCLGLISGHVRRFAFDPQNAALKIPHMGWNQVHQQAPHPLWHNIAQDSRFYFVHSYYAQPDHSDTIAAISEYPKAFACALMQKNIFAVQFHPEKSQTVGLQLLSNFMNWDGNV